MALSRRALLRLGIAGAGVIAVGGAAMWAVEDEVLPGRSRLHRALGGCDVSVTEPGRDGGTLVSATFDSRNLGSSVNYMLSYPPGHGVDARLPVCVMLHGAGWRSPGVFRSLLMHRYLADAVAQRQSPPYVLAACDGETLFWHRRASGKDPAAMVTDEFLPLLARRGLAMEGANRPALVGWSMGGFGALSMALDQPKRWSSVAAGSPAVVSGYDQLGPVAFDSPADFQQHNILQRADALRSVRLRVYCGEYDPFVSGCKELGEKLPDVVKFSPGCHGDEYWRHIAPALVRFIGDGFRAA